MAPQNSYLGFTNRQTPTRREEETDKEIFEELIVEIFPNLGKEIDHPNLENTESQTRWTHRYPH